jgi:hypothetical protein
MQIFFRRIAGNAVMDRTADFLTGGVGVCRSGNQQGADYHASIVAVKI